MAHLHNITGTDKRFYIDPITRAVITDSDNVNPIQYDNNSVRFAFEVPRFVGGHDMALCDRIEIHYINFASATEKSEDVYLVDDISVDEWAEDRASFTWLLSANATKYAGPLDFLIRFICLDGDTVIYAWHTDICKDISVCDGINNSAAAIEMSSDVLEAWRKEVLVGSEEAAKRAEEAATKAETAAEEATGRVEEAVKFATDKVEAAKNEAADRAEAAADRAEEAADRAETDGGISEEVSRRLKDLEDGAKDIKGDITNLEKQLADLNYKPITASLSVSPSTAEVGQSVTNALLTWSVSKPTKALTLDGVPVTGTSHTDANTYTTNKTWTLKATETDKGATATATATLSFKHRVYWGVGTTDSGFDSSFVKALAHSELTTSKAITINISPNTQYIYYAVPKALCSTEPTFIIDKGFAGGFEYKEEITVTNAYGAEIVYYVYRSDQLLVGSTRVDVS